MKWYYGMLCSHFCFLISDRDMNELSDSRYICNKTSNDFNELYNYLRNVPKVFCQSLCLFSWTNSISYSFRVACLAFFLHQWKGNFRLHSFFFASEKVILPTRYFRTYIDNITKPTSCHFISPISSPVPTQIAYSLHSFSPDLMAWLPSLNFSIFHSNNQSLCCCFCK